NPATWSPDPIGNDNFFFNVSPTIGAHEMCAQVRGVGHLHVAGWSVNPASKCGLRENEPNTATAGFPPPLQNPPHPCPQRSRRDRWTASPPDRPRLRPAVVYSR